MGILQRLQKRRDTPVQPKQARKPNKDQVTRLVDAGMSVLYDDKTHDKVVEMLGGMSADPPKALAQATKMIMGSIAGQSKGKIPAKERAQATSRILALVAELAKAAGTFEVTEETVRAGVMELTKRKGKPQEQAQPQEQEQAQPEAQPQAQPQVQPQAQPQSLLGGV